MAKSVYQVSGPGELSFERYSHLGAQLPQIRAPCPVHQGSCAPERGGGSPHLPPLPTGQHVCPLSRRAYILDVASEMAQVDGGYALWFRRVLAWRIPGMGEPVGCRLWGLTREALVMVVVSSLSRVQLLEPCGL